MTHKPTFSRTPRKRPWYERLTPVAWLMIGVLALVIVVGGTTAAKALGGPKPQPFESDAPKTEVAPEPTPTPEPVEAEPEPAQDWWAEALPETPITSTRPLTGVWWLEQMACDGQGTCTPPQAVVDEIVADFLAWRATIPYYYYELSMTPEQLESYYTGRMLETQLEFIDLVAETGAMWGGETVLREYDYGTRVPHVTGCTAGGLACVVGETVQGDLAVYRYDLSSRQIVETIDNPTDRQYSGVNIWRMQYDTEDNKWKIDEYLQWVPAPTQ